MNNNMFCNITILELFIYFFLNQAVELVSLFNLISSSSSVVKYILYKSFILFIVHYSLKSKYNQVFVYVTAVIYRLNIGTLK